MQTGQLFHAIPASLPIEISDCLLQSGKVRIERIVSKGQHSPPDFWYDQSEHEWVLLVKGEATLRFEQGDKTIHLTPGRRLAGKSPMAELLALQSDRYWSEPAH